MLEIHIVFPAEVAFSDIVASFESFKATVRVILAHTHP